MDYRQIDNRKEAFINWFGWSLELEDCDSALYMTNYFFDRFEYNREQSIGWHGCMAQPITFQLLI
jgi:hypothetical protein